MQALIERLEAQLSEKIAETCHCAQPDELSFAAPACERCASVNALHASLHGIGFATL